MQMVDPWGGSVAAISLWPYTHHDFLPAFICTIGINSTSNRHWNINLADKDHPAMRHGWDLYMHLLKPAGLRHPWSDRLKSYVGLRFRQKKKKKKITRGDRWTIVRLQGLGLVTFRWNIHMTVRAFVRSKIRATCPPIEVFENPMRTLSKLWKASRWGPISAKWSLQSQLTLDLIYDWSEAKPKLYLLPLPCMHGSLRIFFFFSSGKFAERIRTV